MAIDPTFTGPTLLAQGDTAEPAVRGTNDNVAEPGNGGPGVQGSSSNGFAIHGISDTSAGVVGVHTSATQSNAAVVGVNRGMGAGVDGRSETGAGVRGNAPGASPAVLARSGSRQTGEVVLDGALALLALGQTVLRAPTTSDGTVILDPSITGQTLQVTGGARTDALFMPVGTGTILAGSRSGLVTNAAAGRIDWSRLLADASLVSAKKGARRSRAPCWAAPAAAFT